jgi:cytochrome b561
VAIVDAQLVDGHAEIEGRPLVDTPNFQILSASSENSEIEVTFVRPLSTGESGDRDIEVDGETQFVLWAHGPGGNTYDSLQHHDNRGGALVNFKLDSSQIAAIPKPKKWTIHGILMVCSLGITLPLGMTVAKFGRALPRIWFPVHKFTQIIGVLAAISGISLGYYMTRKFQWRHHRHASIGTAILVLLVVQVFIALIRPHPGGKWRFQWYWTHMAFALSIFVLSMINIYIGFKIYGVEHRLRAAFTAWMVVFAVLFSIGTLVKIMNDRSKREPTARSV